MSQGRIESNISTQLNPFGPQWPASKGAERAATVGEQVQQALFGRAKPPVLDPAKFPHLFDPMKMLRKYKKKLALMAGDDEDDYDVVLADGTIAMIDENGTIFIGAGFLQAFAGNEAVLVGVLAHEIGHRPKRWNAYRTPRQLSQQELQMLCRHEETRADIFSGKALAEMGLDCDPLAQFLLACEDKPHKEYFPAAVRGEVIREAHHGRAYRIKARKNIFPDYDRARSPKGNLGEY